MERLKEFVVKHFETILVVIILIATFAGTYFVEEKSIVLNFYYLPVLSAGYFLGRRLGVLTAVFSVVVVVLSGLLFPEILLKGEESISFLPQLLSWSGFLILSSIAVGTLYEQNQRRLQDLKNAYIGVLEILSKYLESTDRYTKGHSLRVSEMAREIAIAMELPRSDVENIRVAGLLHDIGKIEVSGEILRKAAALSSEEQGLVDTHSAKGAYLLSSVGSVLREVVPIVMSHHEYFMSGYEHNKNGNGNNNIPLGSRVIAVADAFDAMTSDRPYRKGMPPWEAFEEIVRNTGKQFDPDVVRVFKLVIGEKVENV
jgi:putative nucleotidyltransferase with HDIG domain